MDNCSANKSSWRLLQREHPNKFFQGCVCHGFHLMVADILKADHMPDSEDEEVDFSNGYDQEIDEIDF